MKIAYVTTYDSNDRSQWSGLGHAIMESLRVQGLNVTPLGPLRRRFGFVGRVKGRFYRQFLNRSYEFDREALAGWDYASQLSEKLNADDYDLVFSPGTIPISRLRSPHPIVVWADATFGSLTSHYDQFRSLADETLKAGHRTERIALHRCALSIFASDWAAQSAVDEYGVDPAKVKVVPFGAILMNPPDREMAIRAASRRPTDHCRLITIGVDWVRKGVPRAIELALTLNQRGLPTQLTVVGCEPPRGTNLPEFVKVIGYVDKRTHEGAQLLAQLLTESHFHVLFSIAECFGVVFAEANAHAVPNIASDVGGIPSAVVNERGGRRFGLADPIERIVEYVVMHMRDQVRYAALVAAARQEYDERLNWGVAGAAVKELLANLHRAERAGIVPGCRLR